MEMTYMPAEHGFDPPGVIYPESWFCESEGCLKKRKCCYQKLKEQGKIDW